jgi:hypothetical protein
VFPKKKLHIRKISIIINFLGDSLKMGYGYITFTSKINTIGKYNALIILIVQKQENITQNTGDLNALYANIAKIISSIIGKQIRMFIK